MKIGKRGLYLVLPASLLAIAGCTEPIDAGDDVDSADTEDVAEVSQEWGFGQVMSGCPEIVAVEGGCGCGEPVAVPFQTGCGCGGPEVVASPCGGAWATDIGLGCNSWGSWGAVPGITAYGMPSTAYFNNSLYAVYPGANNQLHYATFANNAWRGPWAIPGAYSAVAPGLAVHGNYLHMAYPAINGGFRTARYGGLGWGGWGTIGGINTALSPALVSYNNRLNLFWAGAGNQVYHNWWDGRAWTGGVGLGINTTFAPGVGVWNNRLWLAHGGPSNRVFLRSWDGGTWGGAFEIPGVRTGLTPTLGVWNNSLNFVYPSLGGGGFGWTAWDGRNWARTGVIASPYAGFGARFGWYGANAALFARGGDNRLYWNRYSNW